MLMKLATIKSNQEPRGKEQANVATAPADKPTKIEYQRHPVAALFRDMMAEEYETLKDDVENRGFLEPIIVVALNSCENPATRA